ncbi:hypothetical protein AX17_000353 [Amanita inopinata Kibby_2008]|nr:hypothetical protein AX17_000353 [Amanita inopinata Kibby_2008]
MRSLHITLCAMATRQSDQQRVRDLAKQYSSKVIPCFGYHPWFSHSIAINPFTSKVDHYRTLFLGSSSSDKPDLRDALDKLLPDLPDPRPLDVVLSELRGNLTAFPNAMLGEVGLDRAFRVPFDYFSSPRRLTPFATPLEHQLTILEAQLDLAVELGRNVSIHSVKSQLATTTLLTTMRKKHEELWRRISIDIHSCGFSPETWRSIEKEHPNVFLSVSTVINGRNSNLRPLIAACASDRILAESDYNDAEMTTRKTWEILLTIAEVKGWHVEEIWDDNLQSEEWGAVRHLEANWTRFRDGNHPFISRNARSSNEIARVPPKL